MATILRTITDMTKELNAFEDTPTFEKALGLSGRSISLAILFVVLLSAGLPAQALETVRLQLQWSHQFEFAGFYAAKDQGYYEDAGLDVDILEYQAGTNVTEQVFSGAADYGLANSDIVLVRLQKKPVVMLGNFFKHSALVFVTKPEIRLPSDLAGRKVMATAKELQGDALGALLRKFAVPLDSLTRIPHTFDSKPFLEGRVGVMSAFVSNELYDISRSGIPYNIIDPANYGIFAFDGNLFTTETEVKNHPGRAKAFLDASIRGWEYALDHPDELVELIYARYSQRKSREALRYEADAISELVMRNVYVLGSIDQRVISSYANSYLQDGRVEETDRLAGFLLDDYEMVSLVLRERAFIRSHPVIRFGEVVWEPLSIIEQDGYRGMFKDYYDLVSRKTGLRFQFVSHGDNTDFSLVLDALKQREIDLIDGSGKTKGRATYASFAGPFFDFPMAIVSRVDMPLTSIESLYGKRVVLANGYTAHEYLIEHYPDLPLETVDDTRQALQLVASNQADATLDNLAILTYNITHKGLANLQVSGFAPDSFQIHSLSRNDWPELQSILQKAHQAISQEEREVIYQKWLPTLYGLQPQQYRLAELSMQERAYLRNKKSIRMCVDPEWMPFERIENGRHIGIAADYIALLEKEVGIPIELVSTVSWGESLTFAEARRCDIMSLAMRTPERSKFLSFSRPYLRIPLVIATKVDQFFIDKIDEVLDEPIGVTEGYAFAELLRGKYPGIRLVEVANIEQGLKMVEQGKLFGYIGALPTLGYVIQRRFSGELKITGKFNENWELGLAIRNDAPMLLDILNKVINTIDEEKQQEILNRWISITYEKGADYSFIWKTGLVAAVLFLLLAYRQRILLRHNRILAELSITDKLTNLYNRQKVDAALIDEVSRAARYQQPFSLILMDLDHFKRVNDVFGHLVGDEVLKGIADILKSSIRCTDLVGRWGGEEFMIICPSTGTQAALHLAESVRARVETRRFSGVGSSTGSFGVATYRPGDSDLSMIKRADEALYQAKANGRNQVVER